jgi:hypothetical protein
MAGVPINKYLNLILSLKPGSYMGLSSKDQECKAMLGDYQTGFDDCFGLSGQAPTLPADGSSRAYWRGRFGEPRLVKFHSSGKVVSIAD